MCILSACPVYPPHTVDCCIRLRVLDGVWVGLFGWWYQFVLRWCTHLMIHVSFPTRCRYWWYTYVEPNTMRIESWTMTIMPQRKRISMIQPPSFYYTIEEMSGEDNDILPQRCTTLVMACDAIEDGNWKSLGIRSRGGRWGNSSTAASNINSVTA